MLDVISIGTATEDVFVNVPRENFAREACIFYPGTKIDIKGMYYFTGGGATNTSVALSRLGLRAGIFCAVGNDDSADAIRGELKREKVDAGNIVGVKDSHTAYSVILTGFGRDRVVLYYSGPELLSAGKSKLKKLRAKWFYITSLHSEAKLLGEMTSRAKKIGAKIAFNPGQAELGLGVNALRKIFGRVDVLLLNSREALKLTGSADPHRNLLKLLEIADVVAITQGREGAYATDGSDAYFMAPFDVKVEDVTGAGDAFGSGFVAAIIKGKGVREAMAWGTANASSVVMHFGTKNILLTEKGVRQFIRKFGSKNMVRQEKL